MKNTSVFNKKTVYNGTSVSEFNHVREILEKMLYRINIRQRILITTPGWEIKA